MMRFINRIYTALAVVGTGLAVGEQLYNRFQSFKRKRRCKKEPFGFH